MLSQSQELYPLGINVLTEEVRKANRIIDTFVYSCSHSIRSPLSTMEGLVTLMKAIPANTDEWNACLSHLKETMIKLESMFTHFQELLINQALKPARELMDLRAMVEMVIRQKQALLNELQINLNLHVDQRAPFRSDITRLAIIVDKLLSNAIRFQNKPQKSISIFVTSSLSGCNIQVRDNGIGISKDEFQNIFKLFHRSSTISTGAGMGLYVANEVVRKMGGTLAPVSEEGIGSTMSLWVPNCNR